MFSISGYATREQLYESDQSLLFRAVREADGLPVIFKVLKDVHPSPERIARFKREYQLTREVELPGVVTVHDFLNAANHWLFVQEDFGGESLARLGLAGRMELGEFLSIADALAGHVATVHQKAIIHKDLNPANIVLNRRTGVVKLIDFGISTRLTRETVAFGHPSLIEGTPAYLPPEQTGRLNQPLDHRADLYALGCTFYELLTGRPPFETADLLEMLHCHLARAPEPPHVRRPDLPPALSAIIARLMSKNAAERYQSARGLQADLARCRQEWQSRGHISLFTPGTSDVAHRLSPPARLHGRDVETGELLATYERVAGGATALLSISGHSGVGKSALVKELYRPVTRGHGFFVTGKVDQFQRDTPYGPFLEALDALIGQVLMEPPARLTEWAAAIQHATGKMLAALAGLLPRLELLLGRLPPTVTLPPAEARHRFQEALAGLLRVFARAEHPLVLFIDDLQWADGASLELLKQLMIGTPIPYLLIIGAYRDHEVAEAHPLRAVLHDIHSDGAEVRELHLEPLDVEDTVALLADMFRRAMSEVREPARLIHHKTGGNPFFIQTVLDTLVARELVFFDHSAGNWQWQLDSMRLLELSDNVVELLLSSLRELPEPTRGLLTLAACIGNHFELGLLAAIEGRSPGEVARALMPALVGNYLIPTTGDYRLLEAGLDEVSGSLGVEYKFAHDRIQQAAYGLSAPGTHAAIHLRIGQGMRAYYTGKAAEQHLLAIVNQLNQARLLLEAAGERREMATLNLEAGRKARVATANAAALDYFERGLVFLGTLPDGGTAAAAESGRAPPAIHERAFRTDYPVALSLTEGAADAAYLVADFATMDRHIDAILRHADRLLDRANAIQIRVNAQNAQMQFQGVIATARELLKLLGIHLPTAPTDTEIEALFEVVLSEMRARSPRELADLPVMTEPEPAAALRVLNSIYPPAFMSQPLVSQFVSASMVLLSLRHGLGEESINGFTFFGCSLCGRERISLGYEFGCLAESLVEKHQRKEQLPDFTSQSGAYIFHWRRPVRQSVQSMRKGYLAGLETGNNGAAANCLQASTAFAYLSGVNLADVDRDYTELTLALERQKQGPYLTATRQYHQAVRNFRGLNEAPTLLQGDVYDELTSLPVLEKAGAQTFVYMLYFNKAILCYHFHDYEEALRCARLLEKGHQAGSAFLTIALLYQCLSLLATYNDAPPADRPAILEEAGALVERMKGWGEECPANYAHKYHLMAAEFARVTGRPTEAREHYDLAVELAHKYDYTHEEGLALERAALFFLERDNPRLAGYYLRDAYYTYGVWGATAKREFLRHRYGYLLDRELTGRARVQRQPGAGARSTTTTGELGELDLATVLAATRAISRETALRQLLETIMRVSMENAGAERGCLILTRDDQLIVKVRGELGEEARFESMSLALHDQDGIAHSVVQYVARTGQPVLLGNATEDGQFANDPHIRATACKSLLCLPILAQGSLVAISYLENNRAASVFNEDRLDVLTLLMGQAAISIENGLLKETDETREFHFRVGGSLPPDSPTYVRRKADDLLAAHIKQGEFCYVFNTRQMGKSSLRVRAVDRLAKAGFACVSIDITAIGLRDVTTEQWYAGIARTLVTGLALQKDFDLRRWWRERSELSPVQRLEVLVDELILQRVEKPIAVFIDEVDAVLGLEFSSDDFFALIRMFYNRRADDPRYQRLTFILLGVTTPADLIRDKRLTPFNIGRAVPLAGFRFDEARSLLPGLAQAGDGERLLRALLDWSGGQPFLTQKLCRLVAEAESRPPVGREREWMTELVRQRVLDKWRHRDEPEHLKTIEARILNAPLDVSSVLALYRRVLENGEVEAGESPEESTLLLSGLVTRTYDKLRVGNPIYAAVFDEAWIEACLASRLLIAG